MDVDMIDHTHVDVLMYDNDHVIIQMDNDVNNHGSPDDTDSITETIEWNVVPDSEFSEHTMRLVVTKLVRFLFKYENVYTHMDNYKQVNTTEFLRLNCLLLPNRQWFMYCNEDYNLVIVLYYDEWGERRLLYIAMVEVVESYKYLLKLSFYNHVFMCELFKSELDYDYSNINILPRMCLTRTVLPFPVDSLNFFVYNYPPTPHYYRDNL